MNYSKDNNQGHDVQISKNNVVFSLFAKDSYLVFVYKKTERLVAGTYLVTELISDEEPLKWQFRSTAMDAVSFAMLLSRDQVGRSDALNDLMRVFVKMLSFCDIAFASRLFSEMNYGLLKKEIENLLDTLSANSKSSIALSESQKVISESFFSVPTSQFLMNQSGVGGEIVKPIFPSDPNNFQERSVKKWGEVDEITSPSNSKGHVKRTLNLKDTRIGASSIATSNSIGDVVNLGASSDSNRRSLIVGLLRTKSNLTIKDFSAVIKGCSDKTIQRELQSLVKSGVLKKEGERRWSRYSLSM